MRPEAAVSGNPRVGFGGQRGIVLLRVRILVRLHGGAVFFCPFLRKRVFFGGGVPVREKPDFKIQEEKVVDSA